MRTTTNITANSTRLGLVNNNKTNYMKKEIFETIMDELHEILVSGYKLTNSDKNLFMNNVLQCFTEQELIKYCDISVLKNRLSKLNQAEVIKSVCPECQGEPTTINTVRYFFCEKCKKVGQTFL